MSPKRHVPRVTMPAVFRRTDTHHAVAVIRDRIAHQVHEIVQERDRAREIAVSLEQENAALRQVIGEIYAVVSTDDYLASLIVSRVDCIDHDFGVQR